MTSSHNKLSYMKIQGMRVRFFCMAIGLLMSGIGYGQDTSFSKEWAVIDSMILKQDLTRSALGRVNQVYRKAKQRRQPAQAVKALLYRFSLEERINTDDPAIAITLLRNEIQQEKAPVQKAILYTLLARQYRTWFDRNRWSLYSRTPVSGYKAADIQTWSSTDFATAITDAYVKALQNPRVLQQQNISTYDAIIIKGSSRSLRPTLYDLLAHDALDYYLSDIYTDVSVDPFLVNDRDVFSPANVFMQTHFAPKDSTSAWRALHLFQQLMAFHADDADKSALIDADLRRLEWAYTKSVLPNKELLYEAALQQLATQYSSVPFSTYVWYQLAVVRMHMAGQYDPFGDTTYRMLYKRAYDAIREAIRLFPSNNPALEALTQLSHQIEEKELSTQTDLTNIPGRPILGSVRYRNTDTMYVKIVRVPYAGYVGYDNEPFNWGRATSLPAYRRFTQPLPTTDDHQPHTAMFKIDALPAGLYLLLGSSGENFDTRTDQMTAQVLQVSGISYIRDNKDLFVLNRQTGQPLASVKVFAWKNQWNTKSRKYIRDTVANHVTDANGHTRFDLMNGSWNYSFQLGGDTLDNNRAEYISTVLKEEDEPAGDYEKKYSRVYFFTDRSIYRPGQLIYFKGIAVTRDKATRQSRIITGTQKEWVYLKDANNKTVDSLSFTLNEYGSFSGQFKIPAGLLTGRFRLETKNFNRSMVSVAVEEYKRPTFEVTIDKAKGSYRLNDSVHITGSVKSYAGNMVGNARVVYTITRNKRFLDIFYMPRRTSVPYNRQIANGEITTDAQGRFSIHFKALADDISDSAGSPVFDYNISVSVTDINGETRSATTYIPVGFASMKLQLTIKHPISDKDSSQQLTIQTTNFSDEPEPAQVHVKIYRLSAPQRMIRERTLQRPDQFIMSKEAFLKDFPSDEYDNELDPGTWAREAMVWESTIHTANSTSLQVKAGLLEAGNYVVEAVTSDKTGATVQQYCYLVLFNRNAAHPPFPSVNFMYSSSATAAPGETGSFISTVPADSTFVISKINTNTEANPPYRYGHYATGMRTIQYPVSEKDRGGVYINEAYVYDNRVYTHAFFLNVPSPDKQLSVQYETYRDKAEPGSNEKWTITIRGNKGEPVAAELLTAMYDASLDQFTPHSWAIPPFWSSTYFNSSFNGDGSFMTAGQFSQSSPRYPYTYDEAAISRYDRLASSGYELLTNRLQQLIAGSTLLKEQREKYSMQLATMENATAIRIRGAAAPLSKNMATPPNVILDETVAVGYDKKVAFTQSRESNAQLEQTTAANIPIQVRKNLTETAFFFPQLHADSTGKYSFSFTMPEALTRWKWMSFSHTKELATGMQTATIITQKELMVQPNAPRFLREGDNMEFISKIVNMGNQELKGQATLELIDATTNTSVDGWFQNIFPAQYFTVAAGQSMVVKFPIQVPFSYNRPLTWRIIAKAGNTSDGEENTLPVLTNRILVTESFPLLLKKDTTQSFRFEKLLNNHSESLSQQGITVEYTSNPVWYAVQALPYLIEYPYECSEQSFNRFYATTLSSFILNKHPRIRQVFEQWKKDSTALLSNLQKNEELKQVLLQETPWVMQAENETQQKKNLALLMDMAKLASQSEIFLQKLQQLQLPNGSFSWFKGGTEDRYITNYILTGIGKLKRLGALTPDAAARLQPLISRALDYLDSKLAADYDYLVKNKIPLSTQHVSGTQIDYLYMRSFFSNIPQQSAQASEYYYGQAKRFWISFNNYYRAQIGLISYRNKETVLTRNTILPALVENASTDTQKGMYWKNTLTSHWYQSPVEYQSMMIAYMSEISQNTKDTRMTGYINDMKTWLLLNKQTNHWGTTIATADACYAILLNGSDWISTDKTVTIRLGNTTTLSNINEAEAGTGYFKKRVDGRLVNDQMGNITVSVNTTGKHETTSPSWGSVYWQYFEDMDKITSASSPLSVTRKLFIEKNTDKGRQLQAIADNEELAVGDKVIIRLEIRSDRDMDYVHLKDTRAASMEPLNVLSGYRWQGGLGYYESTRDTGTDFFFGQLSKGTYVFEYPVYITHTGIFSSGMATIQCMYAPEFTGHSEGGKMRVRE